MPKCTKADTVWVNPRDGIIRIMNKKIILIHGFMRNSRDMQTLRNNLETLGYERILVDLPLTFHPIEHGTKIFTEIIEKIIKQLPPEEKIHLVGHSTGGLVIRNFLANTRLHKRIDRCVLIGTPNNGSELADLAVRLCPPITRIFKTLASLQSKNIQSMKVFAHKDIEMGAIAGNKNNLLLGRLLRNENDGRVTIKSVKFAGLKDFVIIPYGHNEIHYQTITAELLDHFLTTGSFK